MGGTKALGSRLAAASLVMTALVLGAGASSASAAALVVKGTLHVEYDANGTFNQVDQAGSNKTTSQANVNWETSSDIPLPGNGQYRYSKKKTGTITASATLTAAGVNCTGDLSIASANGIENVGQFEFDYGKKGQTLTNQGTLKGVSPVPVNTGFVGQFTDANGTGCSGYEPVVSVGSSPEETEGTIVLKVDLDKLNKSKSKSKTYTVGLTKTYDASYKTDVSWNGTVVVTLKK